MAIKIEELCDESCSRPELVNLKNLKENMLTQHTAIKLADIFKALGDPTRVKIIYALLQNELCVHDLTVVLEMEQSAVSHQLRYLLNLRIVKRRKDGKTVFYSLDDNHIEQTFLQTLQHIRH